MITIQELKQALTEIRFNDIDEFVRKCLIYAKGVDYAKGAEEDEPLPIKSIESVSLSMMRYESRKLLLNKLGYTV